MKKIPLLLSTAMTVASLLPLAASAEINVKATLPDSIALKDIRFPEDRQRNALVNNTKIIYIDSEGQRQSASPDSVYRLINRFYLDQFRQFQDPKAPYFMFMSRKANISFGVGGLVRMRGWYDWNGSVPTNGFNIYSIPIPKNPASMRKLAATPSGSCLFFTIIGTNKVLGDYMAYIEGNFDGYNGVGFKLKKAYFTSGDWTAGYATSTFADPAAQPVTIDGAGPNGKISKTNVLVRYMHSFKKNFSVAGSFEFPGSSVAADNNLTEKCSDYVPDIAAMAQYQWHGGLSHVRLSGLLRTIPYRDLMSMRNRNVVGWGVQLSSMFKVISPLTVYLTGVFGQGHASYTGDLSVGSYDLVSEKNNPGELYAPKALSLTFGAKYNFLDNLYSCLTLATMRYYPKTNPGDSEYKYGQYGAINLIWDITPRFEVGAEYLFGKRMNYNGEHANANRVDALFQFSF